MRITIAIILAVLSTVVLPEEPYWRDKSGNPVPDTAARKSEGGFGGSLVVTPDEDWAEKWDTPSAFVPSFSEADTVTVGQRLMTLIFFANPAIGEDGIVEVRCDLRVTRPDGTISVDIKDHECFKGPISGDPSNIRLSGALLGFVGEPGDPIGIWVTFVRLTDAVRGVSLELQTEFELVGDEA